MEEGFDFGLIGHLESWDQAVRLMAQWRPPEQGVLTEEDIKPLYGWIPPREIFRIEARSICQSEPVRGLYIETFIPPDALGRPLRHVEESGRRQAGHQHPPAAPLVAPLADQRRR